MHRHLHYFIAGSIALSMVACGDDETEAPLPDLVIDTSSLEQDGDGNFILPLGNEGIDYEAVLEASGGTGEDYRWAKLSGRLPPGVFIQSEASLEEDADGNIIRQFTRVSGRPRSGGSFTFSVSVRDSGQNEAVIPLTVTVQEAPEAVEITTTMLPEGFLDSADAYDAPIMAMNGTAPYTWSVISGELPPGLELAESNTNETSLSGMPTDANRYSFTVRVVDADGARDTQSYSVTITDNRRMLRINAAQLPNATFGVEYSVDIIGEFGSASGYTWSILPGGELPPGLMLAPEGTPNTTISGTPTAEGDFTFRIELRDDENNFFRQAFSITVDPPPPPVRITTFELPIGRVDDNYNANISAIGGNNMQFPYTWTVETPLVDDAFPPGLTLNSGTPEATITGSPTAPGIFTFVIRASNAVDDDDQRYIVRIDEALEAFTISATAAVGGVLTLPNAVGGQPYSATIQALGGAPIPTGAPESEVRYNYVVTGGSLPPGLSMTTAGQGATYAGAFDGVATALGTYTATITAFDRLNQQANQIVQITVDPPTDPLVITTTQLPTVPATGCFKSEVLATGGGNALYQWELTAGTLPDGLTLAASGTPGSPFSTPGGQFRVAPGTYPVTIRVSDSFGLEDTLSLTITVDANQAGPPNWAVLVGDMEVDGRTELFVSDTCGGEPATPVRAGATTTFANALNGSWDFRISPNQDAVAFIADLESSSRFDVYVIDLREGAVTASAQRIYTGSNTFLNANEVKWSPDGSKVAILADHTSSGSDELWVSDVSDLANPVAAVRVSRQGTSSIRDVFTNRYEFSPDGNKIAYYADHEQSSRELLYVVDLTTTPYGSPERALDVGSSTLNEVISGGFLWTPDSRGVVFVGDLNTNSRNELYFTDLSGSPPYSEVIISGAQQSSGDVQSFTYPEFPETYAFNPQGTKLFFLGDLTNEGEDDLYVLDYANGVFSNRQNVTQLTVASATVDEAKWSPDGTKIAARGDLQFSGRDWMYVFDIASGTFPQPTNQPLRETTSTSLDNGTVWQTDFAWSPDSTKVAFLGDYDVSSSDEAYIADVSVGGPYTSFKLNNPHSSSAQRVNQVQFSPSGQWIAFDGDVRSSFDELWVANIATLPPMTAAQAHGEFDSTALDAFANSSLFPTAWFWLGGDTLMFRGDAMTSTRDRAWYVELPSTNPDTWTLTEIPGPNGMTIGNNQDVFSILRPY